MLAKLGPWMIGRRIGEGSNGAVYDATNGERTAALKILRPSTPLTPRQTMQVMIRVQERLRTIVPLTHPALVSVWDWGFDAEDATLWVVMQRVEGAPLDIRVRYPADHIVTAFAELASGLAQAHALDIVHADIKPLNVLASSSDRFVLIDWAVPLSPEPDGVAPGSPMWMAPECLDGAPTSKAADVYALGQCLYEVLVGEPAFRPEGRGAVRLLDLHRMKQEQRELDPGVSTRRLRELVMACTRRTPDLRPDMRDVARSLREID